VAFGTPGYHAATMDHALAPPEKRLSLPGKSLWLLIGTALLAAQGWMTLRLFDEEQPWQRLLDAQPILSGRHPLHLYHGYLGARSLCSNGVSCCYDPAFQAGYPKTPLFDCGSRPAEVFLYCAGGEYRPAAYKLGLAICCVLFPLALLIAARGAGIDRRACLSSSLLGLLVFWGVPGRDLLEEGNLDLILATMAAAVQLGMLVRFNHAPGVLCWLTLFLSSAVGWFIQPLLYVLVVPLWLVYYLSVGAKHRFLAWHLALFAAMAGALLVNAVFLGDWVTFWWVREPLARVPTLTHRTFATFWQAALWGEPTDRALATTIIVSAFVGLLLMNRGRFRTAARLLGMATTILLVLTFAGLGLEKAARLGTCQLFFPCLCFAAIPAGHAAMMGTRWLCARLGWHLVLGLASAALVSLIIWGRENIQSLAERSVPSRPLALGLSSEQQEIIETLQSATGPEARILWEDELGTRREAWTTLLPLLTERAFLGGLDPEAGIEHMYPSLVGQTLAGRHIHSWTDQELEDFCRRYNVGWIACWSPANQERFRAWKGAVPVATLPGLSQGTLFSLQQRPHSYALKGRAQLVHADSRYLTFAEVVPENGEVVLSFHFQWPLRVTPDSVQVEREPNVLDPVPFIRLRLREPVACLTLTWDGR
jgi:hypothetical protein